MSYSPAGARRRVTDALPPRDILVVLVVASALRVYRYSSRTLLPIEFQTDEHVATLHYSGWHLVRLFVAEPTKDTHPPLYYAFIHVWRQIFGRSLASIRFPSLIFGVATVYVLYLLGTELRDRRTGLIAAVLAAISPFFVSVSQYARGYALFALSISASWYFLLKFRSQVTGRNVGLYVVSTAIMSSIHVYGGFLVIGQWLYLGVDALRLHRLPIRRVLKLQVSAAIIASPVLIDIARLVAAHPNQGAAPHLTQPTAHVLSQSFQSYLGGQFANLLPKLLLAVSAGLLLVSLLRWWRPRTRVLDSLVRRPSTQEVAVVACLGLPVVVFPVLLSILVLPMWDNAAAIGAALALFLGLSLGVQSLRNRWLRLTTLALLLGGNLVSLLHYSLLSRGLLVTIP